MDLLTEVYNEYKDYLLKYAYRNTGDWTTAEDVVGEAFIRLVKAVQKNPDEYPEKINVAKFMFVIVRNCCIDVHRKDQKSVLVNVSETRALSAQDEADWEQYKDGVLRDIIKEEHIREIMGHIRNLPQQRREVLTMIYRYDMTNKEVATVLRMSVTAVRVVRTQAIAQLKELIFNNK